MTRRLLLCSTLLLLPLRSTSFVVTRPSAIMRLLPTRSVSGSLSTTATPKKKKKSSLFRVFQTSDSSTTTTKAIISRTDRKKRLAAGMAFLTGWADVALFRRYQTFATMLTGNTMWLASGLMEQRYKDAAYYASIMASYLTAVAAFRRMDLSLRKKCLRVCAVTVTALFVTSDVLQYSYTGTRWMPMLLLASAYGIINSIGSEVAGTLTFVVTGHLTKMTNQGVDRFSRKRGRRKLTAADKLAAVQNAAVTGGFLLGAAFACVLERSSLFQYGLLSTIGLLYGMLFYWLDMEKLGGAWWLRKNEMMCELDDDGEPCVDDEDEDDNVDVSLSAVEVASSASTINSTSAKQGE